MTEVCWNREAGPIEANTTLQETWKAVDRNGHDVLPDTTVYANDETGEIWAFATQQAQPFLVNGELMVLRIRLGAGAFRLERQET